MRKHRGRVEDRSRRVCALRCKATELRILRFQCYRLACGLQLRLKPFRHLAHRGSTIGCSRVLPVDLQVGLLEQFQGGRTDEERCKDPPLLRHRPIQQYHR